MTENQFPISCGDPLAGLVAAKFGSIRRMADSLGWKYGVAYRIVTRVQDPTLSELWQMKEAFSISATDNFIALFISPNIPKTVHSRTSDEK